MHETKGISEAINQADHLNGAGHGSWSVLLSDEASTADVVILTPRNSHKAINLVFVGFDPSFPPPPVMHDSRLRPETLCNDVIDATGRGLSAHAHAYNIDAWPQGGRNLRLLARSQGVTTI